MGRKGWTILIATVAGAIIGAVIGYLVGQSALGSVLGAEVAAGLMAIGLLLPAEVWMTLAEFGKIAECCLSFVVVLLASIVALGGLLLWHSLALAALAGVSVMTVLLVVLSVLARLSKNASAVS